MCVDAASDPTRIGSDQVRGVRFEGERMVLIPPPDRRKRGTPGDHLGAHRGGVDPTRNRKFESISLRRNNGFYLVISASYVLAMFANPQANPQQFCRCRWTCLDDLGRSLYRTPVVNTSVYRNHCLSSIW